MKMINRVQSTSTHLLVYPIARADPEYQLHTERHVYIDRDPIDGFHIWGEIPEIGEKSSLDLQEMLVEYSMTCAGCKDYTKALGCVEAFGNRFGDRLAMFIQTCFPEKANLDLAACGLRCVLESLRANFVAERRGTKAHYLLESCPICATSRNDDFLNEDLMHFGMFTLCQSLIQALDPFLDLIESDDSNVDHHFILARSAFAEI